MIPEPEDHQERRHREEGKAVGVEPYAAEQPEGKRHEVVRNLLLIELDRPQPDDREHPEQAQPQPDGGVDGGQDGRNREHAGVDAEVGDDHIPAAMARKVDTEDEHGDGDEVRRDQNLLRHGRLLWN